MKATITDVAKQAGVSMKTVSRVLNNEPNVAQKTRDRVMAVAGELRYSPNLAARGLATSKSYHLALIYDNPSPNYIARVQHGAITACRAAGYHLVVEPLRLEGLEDADEKIRNIHAVLDRLNVDGVILTPPLCDSQTILQTLSALNIPCVRVAPAELTGSERAVSMDDKQAAQDMTDYLISQGHKRIGFISGHPSHSATHARRAGFDQAMLAAGLSVDAHWIAKGDFSFASGLVAAKKLLDQAADTRPTVIFASNDDMAAAVLNVAGRMGLNVPKDISVCGFDDTPLAKVLYPALTTVQQPIYDMGRRAAEILIGSQSDVVSETDTTLKFELKLRDSVTPPQH